MLVNVAHQLINDYPKFFPKEAHCREAENSHELIEAWSCGDAMYSSMSFVLDSEVRIDACSGRFG